MIFKLYLTFILLYFASAFHYLSAHEITIAAASDLKFALDSIVSVYSKQNPTEKIHVTYGSSGKFFEQIQNNAPFDIFFSADIAYPQKLKEKGLTISDVRIYGIGKIVIWSKKINPSNEKMNSLLEASIKKIAIANPDHAPYGARAKESMIYYEIFDKVKSKLVFGENISQAAQFVTTGAADIGIVALSLALSPNMQKEGGNYYIIPESSHKQLEQGYVILQHAKGNVATKKFYDSITSPSTVKILADFGFTQKEK